MNNKLIIHIGHPKTGTSAIQAFLGINVAKLYSHGVIYRSSHDLVSKSKLSYITSGNGAFLFRDVERRIFKDCHTYLYSSELLIGNFLEQSFRRSVVSAASASGLDLEIICYTRDFFEYAFSIWGQYIKRGGGTLGFVDFTVKDFSESTRTTAHYWNYFYVLKELMEIASQEGIQLKVFNYDRVKNNIQEHFLLNSLGLDFKNFDRTLVHKKVNRSLSIAEYEIQKSFNENSSGNSYSFVSDALVQELPNLKSEIPTISQEEYKKILAVYGILITKINAMLPKSEEILIKNYEDLGRSFIKNEPDTFAFSREQIDTIVRAVIRKMNISGISRRDRSISSRIRSLAKRIIGLFL